MKLNVSPFAGNIYKQIENSAEKGFNPARSHIKGIDSALAELKDHIIVFADDLVITKKTAEEYIQRITEEKKPGDELLLAEAKEKSGLSRRILISLLEHMDSMKISKRTDEGRILL